MKKPKEKPKVAEILKRMIDIDHDFMIGNFQIIDENHTEIIELKKRIKKLEEEKCIS